MDENENLNEATQKEFDALNEFAGDVLLYHGERLGKFIDTLNLNELTVLVGYILGQVIAQDDKQRLLPAILTWASNFAAAFPSMWADVAPGRPLPKLSTSAPIFLHVTDPPEDMQRPQLDFYIKPKTTLVQ
jgi:hypothetical protein